MVAKVINDPIPDPLSLRPDLPASVSQLITTAMAKQREERFADATTLLAACEDTLRALSELTDNIRTVVAAQPMETLNPSPAAHDGNEANENAASAPLDRDRCNRYCSQAERP